MMALIDGWARRRHNREEVRFVNYVQINRIGDFAGSFASSNRSQESLDPPFWIGFEKGALARRNPTRRLDWMAVGVKSCDLEIRISQENDYEMERLRA